MTPIHGRATELELLREYLERAAAGDQQLVLIEGDPGVGKTALLQAFARSRPRRFRGPRVFYLQAPDRGEPYQPVHHAALAATSRRLYQRLGGRRQASETTRGLLIDWLGAIPVWGDLIEAILATMDVLQRRRREKAFKAIDTVDEDVEALLGAAHRRPLILLLDELERADADAIGRLSALIERADAGARILIVGAYRPTAPGVADPPVHSLRRTLPHRGEFFRHLRLEGIDAAAVETWLRERLGGSVPAELPGWLVTVSGGHPATLEEALARLLRVGALRREGERWAVEIDRDLLEPPEAGPSFADLGALSPAVAEAMRSASQLGEEFDALTLARRLERDELAVEDQLALGVHYGLLQNLGERTLPDGEVTTAFRFPSRHVRAALARGLAVERRAP